MSRPTETFLLHALKNAVLIFISLYLIPTGLVRLSLSYAYLLLRSFLDGTELLRSNPSRASRVKSWWKDVDAEDGYAVPINGVWRGKEGEEKGEEEEGVEVVTVLVTGVSMQKGLSLARILSRYDEVRLPATTGKGGRGVRRRVRVVGADFSGLAMGRFSRCVSAFYRVRAPDPKDVTGEGGSVESYVQDLLAVIRKEDVRLWISCSGVASAVEDGVARDRVVRETKGRCRCVQFGERDTGVLHEKATFVDSVREAGLAVPETRLVRSVAEAEEVLLRTRDEKAEGRKEYIVKPLLVSDAYRADMTILPLATEHATRGHLARLPISKDMPFIVQEFIGGPEYCTHALVVRGKVRAFVACPSASILMHYTALPPHGVLVSEMLRFTQVMADKFQGEAEQRNDEFTGHMSFDFLVKEDDLASAEARGKVDLWPIECNPRTHTAVVLFQDGEKAAELARLYLDLVDDRGTYGDEKLVNGTGRGDGEGGGTVLYGAGRTTYRWLPHDAVMLPVALFAFVRDMGLHRGPWLDLLSSVKMLFGAACRDATLEWSDPLPAFVLWHVYWPAKLAECLWKGTRWSAINFSTGKVFEA